MFSLLETRNQGNARKEIRGTPDQYESPHRGLPSETPSRDETVLELMNSFSPDLVNEIVQLSRRMNSSVPETIEMTLRNAFCLRVPQKWMRDSWVQGGVVFEGEKGNYFI